ncbi:uncharacterized protein [Spinacia oleracea]|uniref:Uncharacterized protein n=1 Tax=Spinacia oleracea TaxID=3562 RepID=A0ABM3QX71_SPIOL|nr:uncharacterized protein LOC130462971 [Spinacia oleracea]
MAFSLSLFFRFTGKGRTGEGSRGRHEEGGKGGWGLDGSVPPKNAGEGDGGGGLWRQDARERVGGANGGGKQGSLVAGGAWEWAEVARRRVQAAEVSSREGEGGRSGGCNDGLRGDRGEGQGSATGGNSRGGEGGAWGGGRVVEWCWDDGSGLWWLWWWQTMVVGGGCSNQRR